jgi:SagB-type dehydrogenase family enzyme
LFVATATPIEFTGESATVTLPHAAKLTFNNPETLIFLKSVVEGTQILHGEGRQNAVLSITESRLIELGVLGVTVFDTDGNELLRMSAIGYGTSLLRSRVPSAVKLHPYTYFRESGDFGVFQNPLTSFSVTVKSSGVIDTLISPPSLSPNSSEDILRLIMWSSGLAVARDQAAQIPYWQFEDVLFHSFSRGRSDYRPRGATYPFEGTYREPEKEGKAQPDLERLRNDISLLDNIPFSRIIEGRRSIRGRLAPTNFEQIATVLRIATSQIFNEATRRLPHPAKPYPSAGGIHELEFYVVADRVDGISRGLYRFDEAETCLIRTETDPVLVDRLLSEASESWGEENGLPSAMIILTARIPFVTWKYESVGYRMVLLNAGFAMQTICQVATAIGVATCPLGTADSELFARMSGLTEWSQPSIAEIAVAGAFDPNTTQ